ncbi:MAG TPA: helix-turn-helix domain-containing protein [Thermomicrobiales bacterium]|nr:helix-turn-helix domain-containing protein [Thermomicrobiales bacterium]
MDTTTSIRDLPERTCGIRAALDVVGDRWTLLIVREVLFSNRRFSGIADRIGVPRDRLAARLKLLVETGVLEQREYQTAPPRSEYHLTESGRGLAPVLATLFEWGKRWGHVSDDGIELRHHDHEAQPALMCEICGEPVHADDLSRREVAVGKD